MSQCYYPQLSLPTPKYPTKAKLFFNSNKKADVDYLISPFSRSLPQSQKIPNQNWQEFINLNKNIKFGVLGNSKYDPIDYIVGENVINIYDNTFEDLCSILKNSKGLLSIVTGTSHLCFHLGVKNLLFTNQGINGWGINQEAFIKSDFIPTLNSSTINKYFHENMYSI